MNNIQTGLAAMVLTFLVTIGGVVMLTGNEYICPSNGNIFNCNGGVSGARCYLETKGKSPYKMCSIDWEPITNYVDKEVPINSKDGLRCIENVKVNGKVWTCCATEWSKYSVTCTTESGETAGLQELF